MDGMGHLWEKKKERRNNRRMREEERKNWICREKTGRASGVMLVYSEDCHHSLCLPKSLICLQEKHKARPWDEIGR